MNFLGFGARGQQSWPPLCCAARCSLGPAAACGGFGLALRATAAQRWAK